MAVERYVLRSRPETQEPVFRIDYASELNAAQLEAVLHVDGPALVIAGAGSGKTRTLVYRVARLVESGIPPESVLLLTFTRRAAEEMLRRASAIVGADCGRVGGGTFHSFASRVLRQTASRVGRAPNFTILDRGDSEDILQFHRAALGFDRKEIRFPRKNTLAEIFSMSVNRNLSLAELVEGDYPHLAEHLGDFERLRDRYDAYKREKNLLDYDDLLVELRNLLAGEPELARHLGERYRYLMVDEYQDTNLLQAEIVGLLAGPHRNVMAVGDDAQSIYSFRGAHFRNIMAFPDRFPGTRVIALEENYRSTQRILDLANAVIERATERYTKVLRTEKGGGEPPLLVQAENENFQSRFVCQRILELHEEGVPLDEIAVLFRSGFHSFDLEIELARARIPFVKRGGFKFVESAHVKDLLAHLRVLLNPGDVVSWIRVLCLVEGIGPKTASTLGEEIARAGSAPEVLRAAPRRPTARAELGRLADLLDRLEPMRESPVDALEACFAYYQPILERIHRDDFPRRVRDLEQLVALAGRYPALEGMLTDFALEPPSDSVGGGLSDGDEEERLTLSTIHSAKGLEWHTVFVVWVADGRFPSHHAAADPEDIEEERRLFYVAITRAKENLYLSYPIEYFDRTTGSVFGRPARFLEGVSESVLASVSVVEEW